MVGGHLVHPGPAGGRDPGERPGLVAGRVEAERALLVFHLDRLPHAVSRGGALAGGLGGEAVAELGLEVGGRGHGGLHEEPVGGEHHEPGVAHSHEHHEHEVGRVVLGQRCAAVLGGVACGQLVAVVAGGLVAVVAVGDEDRLRPHQPGHFRGHGLVGQRPHPALHAQVVGGLERRLAGHGLVEQGLHLPLRVRVEAEDLAEVCLAGPREQQPVLLRPAHRLLVGMDVAGAESLQAHAGHHAAADVLLPLHLKLLVVDVEGRRRLLHHHPLLPPLLQELGSPGVFVGGLAVARLLPVELDPDHVGRVPLVELRLEGGVDDVVGGRDHLRQGADVLGVIAEAAERSDGGHACPCFGGRKSKPES